MFHLSLNGHNGCGISKGGIGETDGRCPLHRIDNHLLNFRLMIDGEHLMARTEVENLSFSAMPAATAAEHFSAFEPADKHLLIRLGNIKALTVHLLVRNYNFLVQTVYNGMAGIYNPKDFLLAVLTPLQFPGIRSAQLPEDFRGMV